MRSRLDVVLGGNGGRFPHAPPRASSSWRLSTFLLPGLCISHLHICIFGHTLQLLVASVVDHLVRLFLQKVIGSVCLSCGHDLRKGECSHWVTSNGQFTFFTWQMALRQTSCESLFAFYIHYFPAQKLNFGTTLCLPSRHGILIHSYPHTEPCCCKLPWRSVRGR